MFNHRSLTHDLFSFLLEFDIAIIEAIFRLIENTVFALLEISIFLVFRTRGLSEMDGFVSKDNFEKGASSKPS